MFDQASIEALATNTTNVNNITIEQDVQSTDCQLA